VSLTSPQQVGNFPVYGLATMKLVWWILGFRQCMPSMTVS